VGLPPHVTEDILRIFLEDMGAHIDTTTIILDKETGLSKRFGFAKFASQEHARAFVEPNFPTIAWKDPPGSVNTGFDGVRLKVDLFELASICFSRLCRRSTLVKRKRLFLATITERQEATRLPQSTMA
jgi:RNA recognition motif-containing protein